MSPPRFCSRAGLTRTELLVLATVLAIFIAIGIGPWLDYLEKSRIGRGAESAHTLSLLLSQYATDNNDVYPIGEGTTALGKSEGIALDLLQNNFTPNPDIFTVGSTPKYRGTAKDFSDLAAANLSWDFTAGATATAGITAAASDFLPVLYTTGETVDYAAAARGKGLYLSPSGKGPFGHDGLVVAYKGGDALFIPAHPGKEEIPRPFILSEFTDPGPYTQIKP
jgi:hypothetical protein